MTPIIEIEGLSCRYGRLEVVRDLSLQVMEGTTYAFLGTNGAGKTTTIKTLLNLLPPSRGSARVLGTPVSRLGPRELAQIGYVSTDQVLPPTLTLKHLIDYARAIYPTWDDGFCRQLLAIMALPLDRKVGQFSTGMKVKAALLISLAYRPRLLILDEPFSGLDPLVRDELVLSLAEVLGREKCTIFISSHDIDEVERLADWVGIIDQGRQCLSEPLATLRARWRRISIIVPDGAVLSKDQLPTTAILPETTSGSARWLDAHFVDAETTGAQIRTRLPAGTALSISAVSLREIFVAATRVLRLNSQITL
jgi:ABC-2 type transport system ATP-binding protein